MAELSGAYNVPGKVLDAMKCARNVRRAIYERGFLRVGK